MLTGIVFAGRAGAAITAQLASMVVTEQIEAYQSMGVSPTRVLVVPQAACVHHWRAYVDGLRGYGRQSGADIYMAWVRGSFAADHLLASPCSRSST